MFGRNVLLLRGLWQSRPLKPLERNFIEHAIQLTSPLEGLEAFLKTLLDENAIRGNSSIAVKALYKSFPFISPTIEINFELLYPSNFDPDLFEESLQQLEPGLRAQKLDWLNQRKDEIHLELGALLVHEGSHLLHGRTWSRLQDEQKAYGAERAFLSHYSKDPRFEDFARSLLGDLVSAAAAEGVSFEELG